MKFWVGVIFLVVSSQLGINARPIPRPFHEALGEYQGLNGHTGSWAGELADGLETSLADDEVTTNSEAPYGKADLWTRIIEELRKIMVGENLNNEYQNEEVDEDEESEVEGVNNEVEDEEEYEVHEEVDDGEENEHVGEEDNEQVGEEDVNEHVGEEEEEEEEEEEDNEQVDEEEEEDSEHVAEEEDNEQVDEEEEEDVNEQVDEEEYDDKKVEKEEDKEDDNENNKEADDEDELTLVPEGFEHGNVYGNDESLFYESMFSHTDHTHFNYARNKGSDIGKSESEYLDNETDHEGSDGENKYFLDIDDEFGMAATDLESRVFQKNSEDTIGAQLVDYHVVEDGNEDSGDNPRHEMEATDGVNDSDMKREVRNDAGDGSNYKEFKVIVAKPEN